MDGAKPGHTVKFQGLKGAAHLNGQEGTLVKYVKKEGRWSVRCEDGNTVNAKPENLLHIAIMHLLGKAMDNICHLWGREVVERDV